MADEIESRDASPQGGEMRYRRPKPCFALLAAAVAFSAACADQSAAPTVESPSLLLQAGDDVADQHLVLLRGSGIPAGFSASVEALGGTVMFSHAAGVAVVTGLTDQAAETLARDPAVIDVARDKAFTLDPTLEHGVVPVDAVLDSPNDPSGASLFPRQWNLIAIAADAAWAAGRTGSPAVTVAILDSGIDYLYPDLAGTVDLSRSASFVPSDDALVNTYFPTRHPITDLFWHGTHVATTVVSNALIVAGVTSRATLIGVKVCNASGSCPFSSVIMGVLHAADAGADVANMSLGGLFTKAGNGWFVGYINRVFTYANARGMTVVVSAGNDLLDLDHDKNGFKSYCSAPNVLCVSATGPTAAEGPYGPWIEIDAPAWYTNYGRSAIGVAAPGGNTGASVVGPCSQTSLAIRPCQTGLYVLFASGTSMSAAHVSGLAALVVEDVGRNPGRVRAVIEQSADDLGQVGVDPYYGRGRINVAAAVR